MKKSVLILLSCLSLCFVACDIKIGPCTPDMYYIILLGEDGAKVSYSYTTVTTKKGSKNEIKTRTATLSEGYELYGFPAIFRNSRLNYPYVKVENTTSEKLSVIVFYHHDEVKIDEKDISIQLLAMLLFTDNLDLANHPGYENITLDDLLSALKETEFGGYAELEVGEEKEITRPARPKK